MSDTAGSAALAGCLGGCYYFYFGFFSSAGLASDTFDSSLASVSAGFCAAGFWGLASCGLESLLSSFLTSDFATLASLEAYNLAIFFSYAFEGASWFSSGKLVKICFA